MQMLIIHGQRERKICSIKLLDADKSIEQITDVIKRSPGAIISRLNKLGYEFKKDKPVYYNEIASWAKNHLEDILKDEKVTYQQIAELIRELIDSIQEPKLCRNENSDSKDLIYDDERENYREFVDLSSGSTQ